ncbi:MAG: penicillin-binding protein, partial [Muribaculaceae bacterium]|nr:penicillin-binding protein [Muribaculaceae bacterium]
MATTKENGARGMKPRTRRIIQFLWIAFVLFVLAVGGFFILVYNGVIGYMPPIEELKNPQDKFASIIYTSDGQEMGRYFRNTGNRVYADFAEISPAVVAA